MPEIVISPEESQIILELGGKGPKGDRGYTGVGIASVEKTGTEGLVDTYTITMTDGTETEFEIENGSGIASIAKTGTSGYVDTYTITLDNGDTYTFTVINGTSVRPIVEGETVEFM